MLCDQCKVTLDRLPREEVSFFSGGALRFCSLACMRRHVMLQTPLDLCALGAEIPLKNLLPGESPPGTSYSTLLRQSFRSGFECMVAEVLVLVWREHVMFEPHRIETGAKHLYVPDFFLPRYGVWLEVKGEWRNNGKAKFQTALDMLGPERLLIIPPTYRRWFASLSGRLHKEVGI